MDLTLPYPPSANNRLKSRGGQMYLTTSARNYLEGTAWLARCDIDEPMQGELSVTIKLYRPRKRGDIDNRLKLLLDALNGVAWIDDDQIVELHVYRYDDKKDPRVELTIEEVK